MSEWATHEFYEECQKITDELIKEGRDTDLKDVLWIRIFQEIELQREKGIAK